jgi:hypothetical protein
MESTPRLEAASLTQQPKYVGPIAFFFFTYTRILTLSNWLFTETSMDRTTKGTQPRTVLFSSSCGLQEESADNSAN